MLTADELKLAQGFPKDYIIDRDYRWQLYPAGERVKRIGNSVVPVMAECLVEANCPYLKVGERVPNVVLDYSQQQIMPQLWISESGSKEPCYPYVDVPELRFTKRKG